MILTYEKTHELISRGVTVEQLIEKLQSLDPKAKVLVIFPDTAESPDLDISEITGLDFEPADASNEAILLIEAKEHL